MGVGFGHFPGFFFFVGSGAFCAQSVPGSGDSECSGISFSLTAPGAESRRVPGPSGDARDGTDTPGRREPKESRRIERERLGPLHERTGRGKYSALRAAVGVTPSGLGGSDCPPT